MPPIFFIHSNSLFVLHPVKQISKGFSDVKAAPALLNVIAMEMLFKHDIQIDISLSKYETKLH